MYNKESISLEQVHSLPGEFKTAIISIVPIGSDGESILGHLESFRDTSEWWDTLRGSLIRMFAENGNFPDRYFRAVGGISSRFGKYRDNLDIPMIERPRYAREFCVSMALKHLVSYGSYDSIPEWIEISYNEYGLDAESFSVGVMSVLDSYSSVLFEPFHYYILGRFDPHVAGLGEDADEPLSDLARFVRYNCLEESRSTSQTQRLIPDNSTRSNLIRHLIGCVCSDYREMILRSAAPVGYFPFREYLDEYIRIGGDEAINRARGTATEVVGLLVGIAGNTNGRSKGALAQLASLVGVLSIEEVSSALIQLNKKELVAGLVAPLMGAPLLQSAREVAGLLQTPSSVGGVPVDLKTLGVLNGDTLRSGFLHMFEHNFRVADIHRLKFVVSEYPGRGGLKSYYNSLLSSTAESLSIEPVRLYDTAEIDESLYIGACKCIDRLGVRGVTSTPQIDDLFESLPMSVVERYVDEVLLDSIDSKSGFQLAVAHIVRFHNSGRSTQLETAMRNSIRWYDVFEHIATRYDGDADSAVDYGDIEYVSESLDSYSMDDIADVYALLSFGQLEAMSDEFSEYSIIGALNMKSESDARVVLEFLKSFPTSTERSQPGVIELYLLRHKYNDIERYNRLLTKIFLNSLGSEHCNSDDLQRLVFTSDHFRLLGVDGSDLEYSELFRVPQIRSALNSALDRALANSSFELVEIILDNFVWIDDQGGILENNYDALRTPSRQHMLRSMVFKLFGRDWGFDMLNRAFIKCPILDKAGKRYTSPLQLLTDDESIENLSLESKNIMKRLRAGYELIENPEVYGSDMVQAVESFTERYHSKGRYIVFLLCIAHGLENPESIIRHIERLDSVLRAYDSANIPQGCHPSIGIEYETTPSITAEFQGAANSEGNQFSYSDLMDLFVIIGVIKKGFGGYNADFEIATRPVYNPLLLLAEIYVMQEANVLDFNFKRFTQASRGYHFNMVGETGFREASVSRLTFMHNILTLSSINGVLAGNEVSAVKGIYLHDNEFEACSDDAQLEPKGPRVEFKGMGCDCVEQFEKTTLAMYYAGVCAQAAERIGVLSADDMRVSEICQAWDEFAREIERAIAIHNRHFTESEFSTGMMLDDEYVATQSHESANRNKQLEGVTGWVNFDYDALYQDLSVRDVNTMTRLNNIFLKGPVVSGQVSSVNAKSMIETSKTCDGDIIDYGDPHTSLFDNHGVIRDSYYYIQGASRYYIGHTLQIAVNKFLKTMNQIVLGI